MAEASGVRYISCSDPCKLTILELFCSIKHLKKTMCISVCFIMKTEDNCVRQNRGVIIDWQSEKSTVCPLVSSHTNTSFSCLRVPHSFSFTLWNVFGPRDQVWKKTLIKVIIKGREACVAVMKLILIAVRVSELLQRDSFLHVYALH